jgi:hypothetical protein
MKASLVCALLLLGCAAGNEPPAAPATAPSHLSLQQVRSAHTDVLKRLADTPAPQVESCRATQGDCLFQVSDSRARLVGRLRLSPCDNSADFQTTSSCITSQLEGAGRSGELTEYLSVENWCFNQLLVCTQAKAEAARQTAVEARYLTRKRELEDKSETRDARSAVSLTRARIEYLRATLPPAAEVCKPADDVEACDERVEVSRTVLDKSLREDDYDAAAALASSVAAERAEDACVRPELECLSTAVRSYGVFPESKKWVERNLELLSRRQELLGRVSPGSQNRCVAGVQQEHQASIVAAYVAYAHEPVLYYRTQLDKAFLVLHEAQVSCLAARPRTSTAAQSVAASH